MISITVTGEEPVGDFWRAAQIAVKAANGRSVPVYQGEKLLFNLSAEEPVPLVTAEMLQAMSLDEYDRWFPNPTGCTICRNPDCDSPNGKH